MSVMNTVPGFSLVNRIILYANIVLAPTQAVSGLGNYCPSNIGFLAFNYYSQVQWYRYTQAKDMHALALLLPHFTFMYAMSYLGGMTSGSVYMAVFLGLATFGVMILNVIASWTSWATNLPDGYGVYQFFFFGWRTLNQNWHKFFLAWLVFDSILTVVLFITIFSATISAARSSMDIRWWYRWAMIVPGAVTVLVVIWPLILWTELIISRNHIESSTDMVQIWLFIAQVVTMLLPSCGFFESRK